MCDAVFTGGPKARYCTTLCSNRAEYQKNMLDYKWRVSKLTHMAKSRAKQKELPYDLDKEYMISLWESSEGCCDILGIPFQLKRSEKGKVNPYAPSIDRIVPEKGYTKGNVRLVCYQINVALSEFGLEQFDELVTLYNQSRNLI